MNDDDDESERRKRIDQAIDQVVDELRELVAKMDDLLSQRPAIRAFLEANGATHLRELSPEKREELVAFLTAKNAALIGGTKPSN